MPRTAFVCSPTPSARGSEIPEQCMICLDTKGLRVQETVSCGHAFHKQCIRRWLENGDSCPICRERIKRGQGQQHNRLQPSPQRRDLHQRIPEQAPPIEQVQQLQFRPTLTVPPIPLIPPRASEEHQLYRSGYTLRLQIGQQSQEPQTSNFRSMEHVISVQPPSARFDREHGSELSLLEQLRLHQQVVEDLLQASHAQNEEQRQLREEQLKLRAEKYDLQVERELFHEEQRSLRESQKKLHEEQLKLQEDQKLFQEEIRKHQEDRRKLMEERKRDYPARPVRAPSCRVKKVASRAT